MPDDALSALNFTIENLTKQDITTLHIIINLTHVTQVKETFDALSEKFTDFDSLKFYNNIPLSFVNFTSEDIFAVVLTDDPLISPSIIYKHVDDTTIDEKLKNFEGEYVM